MALVLIYFFLTLPDLLLDQLDLLIEIVWSLPLLVHKVHGPALLCDVLVDAQRVYPGVFVIGGQLEASSDSTYKKRYLAFAECL